MTTGRSPTLELLVQDAGDRGREPLTFSVPWPRGAVMDCAALMVRTAAGAPLAVQTQVLDRWPDGSARWTLLDWQADVAKSAAFHVAVGPTTSDVEVRHTVSTEFHGNTAMVNTGLARFELAVGPVFPFQRVHIRDLRPWDTSRCTLAAEDEHGRKYRARVKQLAVEAAGPIRAVLRARGALVDEADAELAELDAWMHFFAGSAAVRFDLVIRNPRKADHPGGLWDLGNGGSIYLRDASVVVALDNEDTPTQAASATRRAGPVQAFGSVESEAALTEMALPLELYQDSSGGENWRSSNHINRHRAVPNTFRGYRLRTGDAQRHGLRATPAIYIQRGEQVLGVAVPHFWQNFPKAIEASADGTLTLRLFPRQYADVHEIQGGEQKTHTFSLVFGSDEPIEQVLAWCRTPPRVAASPPWCCASSVLPYLTPRADDPHTTYLQLVDAAIAGPDTFVHKREVIDEYGWRHFGDIYGDHEAVFHKGPAPLVSHYNNQYDPIAGFAYQFFRSGDVRWLRHMEELALHVIDIDLYHTDLDKPAYNHGLFWHTYHYVDADTGTHRSYPRAAKVCGGGPASEQNYATGLMLHYFLTGSTAAREAVLAMGQRVIDMDDGSKTPFRWLARGDTGLASASRTSTYHGPGRGAANSVSVLLDAHRLSGAPAFLAKAEQLIRRVHSPGRRRARATSSTRRTAGSTRCSCSRWASISITRPSAANWTSDMRTRARACCTTPAGWPSTNTRTWTSRRFWSIRRRRGWPRTCARARSSSTPPCTRPARSARGFWSGRSSSSAIQRRR